MELLGYKIFPRKLKVNVTMKSGKVFFFYCDKFNFDASGITWWGGIRGHGSMLPDVDIHVDIKSVECVEHKTVRLYRIYKK